MNFFLEVFESLFGSFFFILPVTAISFLLKFGLLIALVRKMIKMEIVAQPLFFLCAILVGNVFSDLAWVFKSVQLLFVPQLSYQIVLFMIRIAWIFFLVQYQATSLFIESLVTNNYILSRRQKVLFIFSCFLGCCFAIIAIIDFDCADPALRKFFFEPMIQNLTAFYVLCIVMIPSLCIAVQKMRISTLPRLLKKQLKVLIQGLILPVFIADFIQLFPFKIYDITWITHSYSCIGFSTMFITLAIYFCAKKIFGLRFLNLKGHVQQSMNINFIDDFKGVLERLSKVSNFRELGHITQNFFKETFAIPFTKVRLYIRQEDAPDQQIPGIMIEDKTVSSVETFLETHANSIKQAMRDEEILMYDDIDFTHFYHACKKSEVILKFLGTINADIFLPIYEKEKLIAYIIVERHARPKQFYSNVERDELLVFASYLGNIINVLQNKSFEFLIEQTQALRAELYLKHQESEQCKESIRSFLRKGKTKHIGVLFYKNRKFSYGNQAAKELIDINLNQQRGHPFTQALRQLAQQVESVKGPKTTFIKDSADMTLVVSAVPHLEKNTTIITVSYPTISDTIKHHIDLLKDPSEWDYLLYLQTTQSGKLIDKLIPGSGPVLLNFKIQLLKIALSKKAILLEMPEQDLQATVEIIHHITMREELHVMALQNSFQNDEAAITLFGMNPVFGIPKNGQPLLEKLDTVGTIFIKNIHFLAMEIQDSLATFIKTGFYNQLKSDQKLASNVRIMCSSSQNLAVLAQEGKFSKALLQELESTVVTMPSLSTLPEQELYSLTDGYTQQALMSDTLHHVLALTDKEKNIFAHDRPVSLQELKARIQQILVKKSKKNQIYQEVAFDPAYDISDPDLFEAARLGKKALQEPRVMALLWHKFKNQNKIAFFLGVNRSSVNRRCKEYNLL